jgi:hypothetical protein
MWKLICWLYACSKEEAEHPDLFLGPGVLRTAEYEFILLYFHARFSHDQFIRHRPNRPRRNGQAGKRSQGTASALFPGT